ncbi:ABC-type branched-chain amino acid transport system, substrate-binding protein [Parafrankia irregularis]|uniref:ABC-type branched-chain amino acid transport system, substrate-binding protein n=1 Tax=Parafrankia irregularis TaxID=795642 RepID=A0A0S4QXV7_9ACTN|nr:ABC transporter substrate-binding protein [Parafrankia sp. CH37]CUU59290.1 ABC-type branched-chain amino acid transport system, substrate-binding protein [Parafrankia irregularis]
MGLAAGAVVLLAVAASCSATPESEKGATACGGPGVGVEQVKLGLVLFDSGAASAALASARAGVDARIGLANAAGGIHGRKVVYEWRDDAGDVSRNAVVGEQLVGREGVFGVLMMTGAYAGSRDTMLAHNIPVTGLQLWEWAEDQNVFSERFQASPLPIGRYIQAGGGHKVGILTTGSAEATLAAGRVYKDALTSIGLAATEPISFVRSVDSPAQLAQRLANAGVDSLLGLTAPQDLADIVQAARAVALPLTSTVSLTGYDHGLLPGLGAKLAGVSFPVYTMPFEAGGAALDTYRGAMGRFAPEVADPDQQFALQAYIETDLFLRGLEAAGGCPTREGFIGALRRVSDYDAGGLIEPVDLGTTATVPLGCYAFVQITGTGDAFRIVRPRVCADSASS